MDTYFYSQVKKLRQQVYKLMKTFSHAGSHTVPFTISLPDSFRQEFFRLVDQVNLGLMEDRDNFYGYFLFQMARELRFDISSPAAVNFKNAGYVIYFNPLIFLRMDLRQMESTIKHEILHILSMHLLRARGFHERYHPLAVNMAMDIAVNKYLDPVPPYSTTLEWVNSHYGLRLAPYAPFEYYIEELQKVMSFADVTRPGVEDTEKEAARTKQEAPEAEQDTEEEPTIESAARQGIKTGYDPAGTHDLWAESDNIEAGILQEFTEKAVRLSEKGGLPAYLETILSSLKNSRGELPWNLYLNRLMGTITGSKKKTVTRRDRRQPDRLELRGQLRNRRAKIAVAVDISGSIHEDEFKQAMTEILDIVKNYSHDISIIECDDKIRRIYKVKNQRDLKDRSSTQGGTGFSPVFEYVNQNHFNLLIYFTDGKGEDRLKVIPKGYPVLWIISGRGDGLSLKEPYGTVKKLHGIQVKDSVLDAYDVESGGYSMNNQEKI
ncbi:putative metal-dependent peptidase [Anaerotaenia torta]|uniref:vWA domain-containing protein n=1 Tax=Anaerotaenia torta TaxID=433293 RepID=UPI003D1E65FA